MFSKSERKRKSPILIMTVGALAAVGVASIVRGGKKLARAAGEKVRGLIGYKEGEE